MRVGLMFKQALAIAAAIIPVIAIGAAWRVHRDAALFEAKASEDDVLLGRAIAAATASVWRASGPREARQLVAAANARERDVRIRWVRSDARAGDPDAPSARSPLLAALHVSTPITLRVRRDGDDRDSLFTFVAAPMTGEPSGAIELRQSLALEDAFVASEVGHAILTTAALVATCALIALALGAMLVGRPVRRLVRQARCIGGGDLEQRLASKRDDELGELSRELDEMCNRLASAREQVRHADRLAAAGTLAAGVAHEIGTPLNVISGHAQIIVDDYPAESSAAANSKIVIEQADRVAAIMRQLLDFARRRAPRRGPHDVVTTVRHTLELLKPLAEKRGIELAVTATAPQIRAEIDPDQLQQALTNLAINGMQAMSAGGRLAVSVVVVDSVVAPHDVASASRSYVRIDVRDSGVGITQRLLPKIFEPFVTTKPVGEGTGLGLSVTYGIVREHAGWIDVESTVGTGSRFSIYLPAFDHERSVAA